MFRKVLLALVIILLPTFVLAAEFKTPDKSGVISIGKEETITNLYLAGNTVTNDGKILGDLVVAGNNLELNGNVESSVWAAGNNINLKGNVGNSARLAAGNIVVSNNIGGDLLAAANAIRINEGTVIGGDLYLAGNSVNINNTVNGKAEISAADLQIGDETIINGKLIYHAEKEIEIPKTAVIKGGVEFKQTAKAAKSWPARTGLFTLVALYSILATIVVLLAFVYIFPKDTKNCLKISLQRFWASLGLGLVGMIVTPVVIILFMISLAGMKLAWVLALTFVITIVCTAFSVPLLIGTILFNGFRPKEIIANWKTVVAGAIITPIIAIIPVVGPIAIAITFLVIFGASVIWCQEYLKAQKK